MRYSQANYDSLIQEQKDLVQSSIKEKKGIFLYGNTGVGKTYFLHSLARSKDTDVRNFTELLVEFRDAMNKGFYFDSIKDLTSKDYLFIDDIGSEKTSDFVVEFLYLVVNKRYENMKKTVFATNLTVEEFIARYGERIMSRISEMCIVYEMKGEDRRI